MVVVSTFDAGAVFMNRSVTVGVNQVDEVVNKKFSGVSPGIGSPSSLGRVRARGFITTIGGGSSFITGGLPTVCMVAVT